MILSDLNLEMAVATISGGKREIVVVGFFEIHTFNAFLKHERVMILHFFQ